MTFTMDTSSEECILNSTNKTMVINCDITLNDFNTFDLGIEQEDFNSSTFNFDELFINNIMEGLFSETTTDQTDSEYVNNKLSTMVNSDFNADNQYDLSLFDIDYDDHSFCGSSNFSLDQNFQYDFFYNPLEPISDANSQTLNNELIKQNLSDPPSENLRQIFPHINDENNRRRRNLLYESTCRNHVSRKQYLETSVKANEVMMNHDYAQLNEEKSFMCPVTNCNKIYAKSSHLKAHLRRHSGEKPFVCDWPNCSWKFSRSDELARHKRSHYGIKPYKCEYCEKGFARSDHLAKHRRIHEKKNRSRLFVQKIKR